MGFCRRLWQKVRGKPSQLPEPDLYRMTTRQFEKAQARRAAARNERDNIREERTQMESLPTRHRSVRQKSIDELAAKQQKLKPKKSVSHGRRVEMKSVGGTISAVDRSAEYVPRHQDLTNSKAKAKPNPIRFPDNGHTREGVQQVHKAKQVDRARKGKEFKSPEIVHPQLPGRPPRPQRSLRRTLRK